MRWPWRKEDNLQAKSDAASERVVEAGGQVEKAKLEYEETVKHGQFLHDVVSVVFYHAERNDIVERFTKIARGTNGHA